MNVYETSSDAYLGTLTDVLYNFDIKTSPRGLPCREKLHYTFTVTNPTEDVIKTHDLERNKKIESYTKKEYELYNRATNDVNDFAKASNFWRRIANPDGTVNSAYGFLLWKNKSIGNPIFEHFEKKTPWGWALYCLRNDKDTRQAILKFNLPEHGWAGNKDFPCTMHGVFHIRDNKLHFCINMRSNDLMLGLVYDMPWFISLMYRMVDELKDIYPELEIGYYTHTVHSIHIYEKDISAIKKMLGDTK